MDMTEYFARPDTPAPNSPVGKVMVNVLAKRPELDYQQARTEAHRLLDIAAGRKHYAVPRVMSAEEQQAESIRLKSAFNGPKIAA